MSERPAEIQVRGSSGEYTTVAEGTRMVFGRGPDVDLVVKAGRNLSRRAGVITAMPGGGAWVANLSRTHALYAETEGQRIRLPRLEATTGQPVGGWFQRIGSTRVGSRAMLDEGHALSVDIVDRGATGGFGATQASSAGDPTLLPIYFDPGTKVFLAALLLCRPWLIDPPVRRRCPASPRSPATPWRSPTPRELERVRRDADLPGPDAGAGRRAPARSSGARSTIARSYGPALGCPTRSSSSVLIEHAIITTADLARLDDPAWRSRQEDLWWH